LVLFVFAACTQPGRWENPGVPSSQWSKDEAQCRYQATRKLDREYSREHLSDMERHTVREDLYQARMTQYEFSRRRAKLVAACMADLGYVKATPSKDSPAR